MKKALEEANIAYNDGNVPVGAVIAKDNDIIAFSHNVKNSLGVSVYHAEMLCIIDACKSIGSWYLDDCVMYVTLRPCRMCEAAIAESRIKKVYYLLDSNYSDNLDVNISNISYKKLSDEGYSDIISDFFKKLRLSDVSRET